MTKKIMLLFALIGWAASGSAADISVVNDMDAVFALDLNAVNEARAKLKSFGGISPQAVSESADMQQELKSRITGFLEDVIANSDAISLGELTKLCQKNMNDAVVCLDFIDAYMGYNIGDSTDCTVAKNARPEYQGHKPDSYNFADVYSYCLRSAGNFAYGVSGGVLRDDYESNSIVGQCKTFLYHVERCQNHLISYYADLALNKNENSEKYNCVLNLLKTGEMDLPVTNMENRCK